MTTPAHFRFLLDSVEYHARRTDAILFDESRSWWEDIVEAWDRREEKRSYWLFCSRWLREDLLRTMRRGSARALLGILAILRPELVPEPGCRHQPSPMLRRRIEAHLLPIMLREVLARVRAASADRLGPYRRMDVVPLPNDLGR